MNAFRVAVVIVAPLTLTGGIATGFVPTARLAARRTTEHLCSICQHHERRSILRSAFASILLAPFVGASLAGAQERRVPIKPFAPPESLLPAARVKLLIDRATAVASELANGDAPNKPELAQELAALLLVQQNFTRSSLADVPKQPARRYLDSYRQRREQLPPLERPGALLEQRGEIDAWRRQKRQEREREGADEIRAALNAYTNALSFDADSYVLTAPREVRSQLIREDRLPDVKTVIASDMGMRYLYRNEILTAMEEVRAELVYQLQQEEPDGVELLELLQKAQRACDRWFSLINEKDTMDALDAIEREIKGQHVQR